MSGGVYKAGGTTPPSSPRISRESSRTDVDRGVSSSTAAEKVDEFGGDGSSIRAATSEERAFVSSSFRGSASGEGIASGAGIGAGAGKLLIARGVLDKPGYNFHPTLQTIGNSRSAKTDRGLPALLDRSNFSGFRALETSHAKLTSL